MKLNKTTLSNTMNEKNVRKYLLIHGAYHGSWCWEEVKADLEKKGNLVYTIDLPGHGVDKTKRNQVDVTLYVKKVQNFIEENNLQDLTLVGHSFAGVIITKLLENISERIKNVIFINAVILDDGEMFFDYFSEALKEKYIKQANESIDNSIIPNAESLRSRLFNDLTDEKKFQDIFRQLTPQPITPYKERIFLKEFKKTALPIFYIFCQNDESLPKEAFEKILSKLPQSYKKIDIKSDHEVMFSHPHELAEIINNI